MLDFSLRPRNEEWRKRSLYIINEHFGMTSDAGIEQKTVFLQEAHT